MEEINTILQFEVLDTNSSITIFIDMCINTNDIVLIGDENSAPSTTIMLNIVRCSGTSCATNINSLHNFFKNIQVSLYTAESYYDDSDPTNPIKQYIKTENHLEINYNIQTRGVVQVRENEVIFLNGTTKTFYDTIPMQKSSL